MFALALIAIAAIGYGVGMLRGAPDVFTGENGLRFFSDEARVRMLGALDLASLERPPFPMPAGIQGYRLVALTPHGATAKSVVVEATKAGLDVYAPPSLLTVTPTQLAKPLSPAYVQRDLEVQLLVVARPTPENRRELGGDASLALLAVGSGVLAKGT